MTPKAKVAEPATPKPHDGRADTTTQPLIRKYRWPLLAALVGVLLLAGLALRWWLGPVVTTEAVLRRAASGLATVVLSAEVGVIDLQSPSKLPGLLALVHDLHDLGLADELHRQEPLGQDHLGRLEDRAGDQAALVPALAALEVQQGAPPMFAVLRLPALGADKPIRPPPATKDFLALLLGGRLQPRAHAHLGTSPSRGCVKSEEARNGAACGPEMPSAPALGADETANSLSAFNAEKSARRATLYFSSLLEATGATL